MQSFFEFGLATNQQIFLFLILPTIKSFFFHAELTSGKVNADFFSKISDEGF